MEMTYLFDAYRLRALRCLSHHDKSVMGRRPRIQQMMCQGCGRSHQGGMRPSAGRFSTSDAGAGRFPKKFASQFCYLLVLMLTMYQ